MTKSLYKYLLIFLRWIPMLLAICCILTNILAYYDIDVWIINLLGGVSIIPLLFIFLVSYLFKFCTYHRIPLYYIVINLGLSIIDSIVLFTDIQYLYISSISFGVIMCWFILNKYSILK